MNSTSIFQRRRWRLRVAILSLSLLTVMAGAAVAPALNLIREYFSDCSQTTVQMIISMPALFIALTNLFLYKPLCMRFRARTLLLFGLSLYTIFGCIAGLFSNIYLVLICRALVGVGVGIIMPMSTGLIAFYFTKDQHQQLMGLSSAMNMMGGVVATIIAGVLASYSWRLSFLVYLMGLISIVLCAIWMPNERIFDDSKQEKSESVFKLYYPFIIALFLLMICFFTYPASFAIETAKQGIIPQHYVAIIMAFMDISGFFSGLIFPSIIKKCKNWTKYVAPLIFILGYVCLSMLPGWFGTLVGSFLVGFANGMGIPFIMATASAKAGKSAAVTVMPLLSIALYSAQFLAPFLLSITERLTTLVGLGSSAYVSAIFISLIFLIWSITIPSLPNHDEQH